MSNGTLEWSGGDAHVMVMVDDMVMVNVTAMVTVMGVGMALGGKGWHPNHTGPSRPSPGPARRKRRGQQFRHAK